jgi:hypothetical protein
LQRSSLGLGAIFALFLAAIVYIVASSMSRRAAPTFAPTPIAPRPPANTLVIDTITVDARDPVRWAFVDFDRQSVVLPPDTAGWDLAVRRFHVIASDAIADLGEVAFDSVHQAPESGYVANTTRGDTLNPAIQKWYAYSMLTHLLEPNGHVYAVRTREGRYAKLQILSYYCEGLKAGCLTFRYAYRGDGGRRY